MILEEMKIESGQKQTIKIFKCQWEDFPGGPVIKTLPFDTASVDSIPGQGAMIPHDYWPKY